MRPMPELKTYDLPTATLVPYARNAKTHTQKQVDEIAASIEEFGFNDPVGVWENANGEPEIVEGHGRVLAAKKLGMKTVPVLYLNHLDDEQRRAYGLVHNKLTMNTDFDFDALTLELESLDLDMSEFGFDEITWDADQAAEDFRAKMEAGDAAQENTEEYDAFVEKFAAKKTTDDCYTPENIYQAVKDWAVEQYGLQGRPIVRPFYPGGDYQREKYPAGAVVIDNPPFSILSEICRWYKERGIDFFLFAPALQLFAIGSGEMNYIGTGATVTYENGAKVGTSFVTNLGDWKLDTAPGLSSEIVRLDKENRADKAVELPVYKYPDTVISGAQFSYLGRKGADLKLKSEQCSFTRGLDCQKDVGKAIFGGGFFISERAAKERAAEERAAEERAAKDRAAEKEVQVWQLSEREQAIVDGLRP